MEADERKLSYKRAKAALLAAEDSLKCAASYIAELCDDELGEKSEYTRSVTQGIDRK